MKSVRSTCISATDGGEVVVNAINTLEKRDLLKKAKTNFLSSVCVRVKQLQLYWKKKNQTNNKKPHKPNANV